MTMITGREPRLGVGVQQGGFWKLSPRRLATLLNILPPDAVSLPAMAAALHHDNFGVRYNAAHALSRRGDRDARLVMQEALRQGNPRTRASIARHLSGFSWHSAKDLIAVALQDEDARVREGAVYAMCDFIEAEAYASLAEFLAHEPHDDVRLAAAVALRDRQDPAAVPVLAAVMGATDPDVRIQALRSLGANLTRPAQAVVLAAIRQDGEAEVVYEATLSLMELAEEQAVPMILEVLHAATGDYRAALIRGLFHASNYMVINLATCAESETLLDALGQSLTDPIAREDAVWPLAWIQHETAHDLLWRAYADSTDLVFKGHVMRVAWALMSPVWEAIYADAREHADLADYAETLATTPSAEQDLHAPAGTGFRNPVLGR